MPALAWTYNSLLTALQAWPKDAGTEYVTALPTIIGLGEKRLVRDLNLDIFDHITTIPLGEGETTVTKPEDLIQLRSMRIGIATGPSVLDAKAVADELVLNIGGELTYVFPNGTQANEMTGEATLDPPSRLAITVTASPGSTSIEIRGEDENGDSYEEEVELPQEIGVTVFTEGKFSLVDRIEPQGGNQDTAVDIGTATDGGSGGGGPSTPVLQRSWDYCHEYVPDFEDEDQRGRPEFFNELNDTEWELVPPADQDYGVIVRYVRMPTALSASAGDQSTWLSEKVPDLLFAACLMEAEHFLKADDRYADYANKYHQELLPVARAELRNSIKAGDYNPFKPAAKPAA